jgi:hypothetical protein
MNFKRLNGIVFIGGSIAEGYANSTSDIDVFCIANQNAIQPTHTWGYRTLTGIINNNQRFELEHINTDTIEELKTKAHAMIADNEQESFRLTFEEYQFIQDILIGKPFKKSDDFYIYQNFFKGIKSELCNMLCVQNSIFFNNTLEDIEGLMEDQENDLALLRSFDLLNRLTDYMIAANGCLNTKTKWRLRKLSDLHLDGFRQKYLSFYTSPITDTELHTNKIIDFCTTEFSRKSKRGHK